MIMMMMLKGKLSRMNFHNFCGKALKMQILEDRLSDLGEMHIWG